MESKQEEDLQFFVATETDGQRHTLLRTPRSMPPRLRSASTSVNEDAFNILMADVSGSMCSFWSHVVTGWENNIRNNLEGHTKIFVFDHFVKFVRSANYLTQEDFSSGGTNLTAALKKIREEVDSCSEKYIRVFIITDGHHGSGEPLPDTEISLMNAPQGKRVDVYLLGIGYGFPVNYSIDIRSFMHTGSANVPSLFWAKEMNEIEEQMRSIGNELSVGRAILSLNYQGYTLPGLDKSLVIHLGEWNYFPESPEDLPPLTVKVNDEPPKTLPIEIKEISVNLLVDQVFRQWSSVLLQQHRKKQHVPIQTFDLMETLFKNVMNKLKSEVSDGNSVKERLQKKNLKKYEVEYATLMNQSKTVIGIEGKYQNEIELAETILKSTVTTRKYDTRNLKMKGHGQEDYGDDIQAFLKLYEKAKPSILQLPQPTPDDCCRITMTSTLLDMQDSDFHLLFEENKFDFLKTFTMTGIPVYAPVRDASQINPWTFGIKHMLVTPFTILSQRAIEAYAECDEDGFGASDKDVILQKSDEKTRFNAIIPIVPESAAGVLKPLVRSNLYAMLATFCILKNPHIIDHNAHIAALGCAWVKSITDYPPKDRPEFVQDRLKNILATAKIYMDRGGILRYVKALLKHPKQALMTESTEMFDGHTLKCESFIKPLFFLGMVKDKLTMPETINLLKLMLAEFIGRCLSNYKVNESEATPYTDFFASELNDPVTKKAWLEKHSKNIIDTFKSAQGNLVEMFYSIDDLRSSFKAHISTLISPLSGKLLEEIALNINMEKVKKLSNYGSCGYVKIKSFHAWAEEMGVPNDSIKEASDPSQVLRYVNEALQHHSSKERLSKDLDTTEEAMEFIKKKVIQENTKTLKESLLKEGQECAEAEWHKAYTVLHSPLVMPLKQKQIIEAAQAKGIEVTEETFSRIYRYDERLGLLRNACQIPGCPHYLSPHRNFNQHLAVEREHKNFPHCLHLCPVHI
ncbi:hypothetical protein Hamer_G007313, partial [Homarus americanus]